MLLLTAEIVSIATLAVHGVALAPQSMVGEVVVALKHLRDVRVMAETY
jgi:hypothetical protein